MKHSDRPIFRPREDVLGRSPFALALARAIDRLPIANDGFVIAVLGEWGTGKSSVVEMTIRFLTHIEMERASESVLWGDRQAVPENLETLEALAETFDRVSDKVFAYDMLNLDFSRTQRAARWNLFRSWLDTQKEADKADRYWKLFVKIQERRRTTLVRFSPWLIAGRAELASALLSELARALGEKLGPDVQEAFASMLERLSEFAPIAGAGLDAVTGGGLGKVLASGGAWPAKFAAKLTKGPTLDQLREKLRSSLRKQPDQRVLALQLHYLLASESMSHHDSGDHGWLGHWLRRRWSCGRRRCGR